MNEPPPPSPQIQSVIAARRIAANLRGRWNTLEQLSERATALLRQADEEVERVSTEGQYQEWLALEGKVDRARSELHTMLRDVRRAVEGRNPGGTAARWGETVATCRATLDDLMPQLRGLGEAYLGTTTAQWQATWDEMVGVTAHLSALARGAATQLEMLERFAPDEIDALNAAILRHIPESFDEADAALYERDYLRAMKELEAERSADKNLWDRFLDLLAGGARQSVPERVMMRRWIDAEKGQL